MRKYKALDILPLAENEKHIKDYHCSELNFPKSAGFLRVTNRRVIFYGFPVKGKFRNNISLWEKIKGGNRYTILDEDFIPFEGTNAPPRIVKETYLEGINSVSSFYGKKILLIPFILACLTAIGAMVGVAFGGITVAGLSSLLHPALKSVYILGIIVGFFFTLAIAYILLRVSMRNIFSLKIYGASAHDPISIGEGYRTLLGADKVFAITARPSEHTNEMMLELGTLISDLNKGGMGYERAIAKWQAIWEKGKPAETQPLTVSGDTPIAKKKLK